MSYTNTTSPPLNNPYNNRYVLDQNYIVTFTAPNAANTVNSSGLDLLQAVPYPTTDRIDFNVLVPTGTTGANNKNINFVLQDSADNGNWANAVGLAAPLFQVTDNGNTNTNTANYIGKFQPGGRRYVRIQCVGEANGGNGGNASLTFQLLF